jgi:hypothetical protein
MSDKLARIENYIFNSGIELITYNFKSDNIKAMCSNNIIALSPKIETAKEKLCILMEELAHIRINTGDISQNSKEELKARSVAYNSLIGLEGIVASYKHGCITRFEMAEYLEVTEKFLDEAINWYKSKYGLFTIFGEYKIQFIPTLSVNKII